MGTNSEYTGITLQDCKDKLQKYLDAEEAVLLAQEYVIDGKDVTKADLQWIQKGIELWKKRCIEYGQEADGTGGSNIVRIVPIRQY